MQNRKTIFLCHIMVENPSKKLIKTVEHREKGSNIPFFQEEEKIVDYLKSCFFYSAYTLNC